MSLYLAMLLAIVVSACGVWVLQRHANRLPLAAVTGRSLHGVPTPRVGGLAVWVAWLPLAALTLSGWEWAIPIVLIIGVSALDDWRGVHPAVRFMLQLVAAVWWVASVGASQPLLTQLFWMLLLAWSANLYNFMDGIDGLAAAMALFGFGAYAVAAGGRWPDGQAAAALMVASVVPVLAVTWPPARMFMGDVGAVPLGFLAATLGMEGASRGIWPLWFPLLVFLPFWADATFTLCKRLLRREKIWMAHREHGYQKLVLLGYGHSGALTVYGALMLGCGGSALYAFFVRPGAGAALLQLWATLVLMILVAIDVWHARELKRGHGNNH